MPVLRKRFFGGGAVEVSVCNADFFRCWTAGGHIASIVLNEAPAPPLVPWGTEAPILRELAVAPDIGRQLCLQSASGAC